MVFSPEIAERMAKIKDGYIRTDTYSDGSEQWVKKLTDTSFIVIEKGNKIHIDLNKFTKTELEDYVSAYYSNGLDEIKDTCGDMANQVIAEIISEVDG